MSESQHPQESAQDKLVRQMYGTNPRDFTGEHFVTVSVHLDGTLYRVTESYKDRAGKSSREGKILRAGADVSRKLRLSSSDEMYFVDYQYVPKFGEPDSGVSHIDRE